MSVRCPEGHESESADYCDVCGAPIAASAPVTGASGAVGTAPAGATAVLPTSAPPAGALRDCPNCGFDAPPDALFCEECGYDFTTGALPAAPTPLLPPGAETPTPEPDALAQPVPPDAVPPPPTPAVTGWVAEVWVDPDWYATQDSQDPCPSAGMPVVVPLTQHSLLVGRRSVSRNITPQIDAGGDTGVSRRHAQLTTDGHRWWVEDLQSSNGTYVGAPGAPLPTAPVPQGQRVEFSPGDRIYLGAWTRLVVRQSLPGETP